MGGARERSVKTKRSSDASRVWNIRHLSYYHENRWFPSSDPQFKDFSRDDIRETDRKEYQTDGNGWPCKFAGFFLIIISPVIYFLCLLTGLKRVGVLQTIFDIPTCIYLFSL